jgi:hypothetical protein
MVDATLSTDDSAMGRLTPEDVSVFLDVHPSSSITEDARQLGFLFRL